MQFLLISAGTAGNMLPFVGLGRCLRQRGHQVLLAGSLIAREAAIREGLEFVNLDPPMGENPFERPDRKITPGRLFRDLTAEGRTKLHQVYDLIAQRYIPGETVVVCQGWLFGGRIAQERLGVPLATVHLQPILFRSLVDRRYKWAPAFLRRAVFRLADYLIDASMGKAVNDLRQELGLPPVSRLMNEWWRSPQLVLGFFPEWFAPPLTDWPAQTLLTGFPRYDALQVAHDQAALDTFLEGGPPPLVFSQASIIKNAREYFEVCIQIAQQMHCRAILLTAHPEYLPSPLPPDIKSFGFVPLTDLLTRSAAFVHHGGMGSISQALSAGVPQLTVPKLLDQHDNCRYLEKLGLSVNIKPRNFRAELVVPKLKLLLSSETVASRCRKYAELSKYDDAFERAAEALERLAHST